MDNMGQSSLMTSLSRRGKKKDWSISMLRLASMIAIIFCHICQALNSPAAWWLNIGVQVFLIISGYLYGVRDGIARPVAWFVKRLRKIWVPFAIAASAILIVDVAFNAVEVDASDVILGLLCFRPGSIPNGAHLWYIAVALLCYLITPALFALRRRFGIASLSIPLALLAAIGGEIVPYGFWAVEYIVGFALGSFVKKIPHSEQTVMGWGVLLGVACMAVLFALYVVGAINFRINGDGYIVSHLALGLLIFCFVRWALRCSNFEPGIVVERVLNYGDTYSYEIYLTHQTLILGTFSVFKVPMLSVSFAIAIVLIWAFLSGMLLQKISIYVDKGLQKILDEKKK